LWSEQIAKKFCSHNELERELDLVLSPTRQIIEETIEQNLRKSTLHTNCTMSTCDDGVTLSPRHPARDDPRAPCVTHPTHLEQSMSTNMEGVRSTTTSSIDIQDAFQRHYSSRAVQNSKHNTTDVRVEIGEDNDIFTFLDESKRMPNLSGLRRTHSDQMLASICESNTSVGSTRTLAKMKSHTDLPMVASDMSDQQIPYNNNGKATIDRNFFKSMAKMIKANRPSRADADVVNEKACTHYTACNTSNSSCGEKTGYVRIEGQAMRAHRSQVPLAS
jgi:hypothetical protein